MPTKTNETPTDAILDPEICGRLAEDLIFIANHTGAGRDALLPLIASARMDIGELVFAIVAEPAKPSKHWRRRKGREYWACTRVRSDADIRLYACLRQASETLEAIRAGRTPTDASDVLNGAANYLTSRLPARKVGDHDGAAKTVSAEGLKVLAVLANNPAVRHHIVTLAVVAELSEKTVGKIVTDLIAGGFAERPNGKRGGVAITNSGSAVVRDAKRAAHADA